MDSLNQVLLLLLFAVLILCVMALTASVGVMLLARREVQSWREAHVELRAIDEKLDRKISSYSSTHYDARRNIYQRLAKMGEQISRVENLIELHGKKLFTPIEQLKKQNDDHHEQED